jgi:hypothetical protein
VAPTKGPGGTTITVHGAGCPQEGWGHFTWTVHVQIGPNGSTPGAGSVTNPCWHLGIAVMIFVVVLFVLESLAPR